MPVVELLRGWRNEKNEGMCENSQGNVQVKHLQSASFYSAVEMVVNAADDATVVVSFDRARTTMTKATGDDTNSDEQAQENDNHHQQNTDIVIVARLICKLRHSFDHVHISHDCNTTSSNSSSAIRVDRVRRTFKQADMETVVIHGFADMGMHEDVGVTQLRSSSKGEWSAVVIDLYARRQ